jgi:cytochrome bd-type quinol oxidase subunit 2
LRDFAFTVSNFLLAVLFGTALGNQARGVSLDSNGEFHLALFTGFQVRGHTGLLDWYTISLGVFTLVILAAHGATYLMLKTEGPVHMRSEWLPRRLWLPVCAGLIVISIETSFVRPEFFKQHAASTTRVARCAHRFSWRHCHFHGHSQPYGISRFRRLMRDYRRFVGCRSSLDFSGDPAFHA